MGHFSRERLRRSAQRLQDSLPAALAKRFVDSDLMTQAASLAFYALLSLAPLLVLILWITASLYPSAQQALVGEVGALVGSGAQDIATTVIANATQRPDVGSLAGLWSTLLLFLGATAVFARLQGALNLIFHSDAKQLDGVWPWLRKRMFSFGVVFALGFLLLVSVSMTTALQVVFANVPSVLPVLGNAAAIAVYSFGFALLYHYLPDRRVRWRQALTGGVITALLFVLGRWAIGVYIARAAPGSAYGSMGTLVILLVWMYYAAVVFFVGALLTAVIDERATAAARDAPRSDTVAASEPDTASPSASGQATG